MRRLLVVPAALAAAAIAVPVGIGSSHREAPDISLDPSADNTDTYAWTAKDAPGALTVAADWIPGEVPGSGPNFFGFDDKARYYIHVDNTGDGRPDVSYRYQFKTQTRNKNSFLYALPGASGYGDSKLNVIQRYSVVRETYSYRGGRTHVHGRTIARGLPVAPPNIGPKTFPNYQAFVDGAIRKLGDGTKVFVGQRDDPFFVDLGATFDGLNVRKLTGNQGQGKDDLSGMNTHSIVMQIPEARVTKNGRSVSSASASNAVVGVWSTTERRRLDVARSSRAHRKHRRSRSSSRWVQVVPPGQPAGERGGDPPRQEGPVQPHHPGSRREALRQVRGEAGAGGGPQRAVQGGRPGERPHGHRAGAAPGTPGPEPAQGDQGPAGGGHDQAEPRRAARERRIRTGSE